MTGESVVGRMKLQMDPCRQASKGECAEGSGSSFQFNSHLLDTEQGFACMVPVSHEPQFMDGETKPLMVYKYFFRIAMLVREINSNNFGKLDRLIG